MRNDRSLVGLTGPEVPFMETEEEQTVEFLICEFEMSTDIQICSEISLGRVEKSGS